MLHKSIYTTLDQQLLIKSFWNKLSRKNFIIDNRERRNIIYKHSFFVSCRKLTSLSLKSIGSTINKDHATVLHALKINEINYQGKKHYIRPEHIKIVEKSKYKINIIKSLYQGKDYKVKATHNLNEFHFYSKDSYEPKTTLHFDFDSKNLIFFNKKCESYFT